VLTLSTAALTVLAVERERLLHSLAGQSQWPPREWPNLESALFDLLGSAADLAKRARVALVWADAEEPWTNVALLGDELTLSHVAPNDGAVVQHIDPDESFVCDQLGDGASLVTRVTAAGLVKWRGAPLSAELLAALAPTPHSIIGVRARGRTFSGHLLILDIEKIPSDLVLHAEVVARQIAGSLDMWLLARRTRELAAREERGRVWRDLHDGVLQSLTGLALMLTRAEKAIESDQAAARRILDEAAALVHDEQRDLRFSILEQKAAASSNGLSEDLPTLIAELAQRFERVWGLRVETRVDPNVVLGPSSSLQIARMIQEALSNSARHGHSTYARLAVSGASDALHVCIEDNGKGFPFVGTFDHATLIERRLGPVLLKDRVQRLQGTLGIRSAPTGVELDIRIPLHSTVLS
jgi:signal transduction histidine kinase